MHKQHSPHMQGSQDTQPMADFATWINNAGSAADGLHNKVSGVMWWAWNANSGTNNQTCSVVLDSLYDGLSCQLGKEQLLCPQV